MKVSIDTSGKMKLEKPERPKSPARKRAAVPKARVVVAPDVYDNRLKFELDRLREIIHSGDLTKLRPMTTAEIAFIFNVNRETVKKWISVGKINREGVFRTPGGRPRVHEEYVQVMMWASGINDPSERFNRIKQAREAIGDPPVSKYYKKRAVEFLADEKSDESSDGV